MAIVKMNKFTLLTLGSQKEELLRKLQGFANVQFINLQDEELLEENEALQDLSKDDVDVECAEYEENLSKAKSALEFLTNYLPKKSGLKGLADDKEYLTIDELENQVKDINWIEIYNKVNAKEQELHSLENNITKLPTTAQYITKYINLPLFTISLNHLVTKNVTTNETINADK